MDESGSPWTRLPADQLRNQLEREFLVEVSTRSIQRALKELEESNQIRREQRWKHRYRRDYWYALPEHQEQLEQQRPRTIESRFRSDRSTQSKDNETTPSSVQVLSTPDLKNQFSREQTKTKPERRDPIRIAVDACMRRGRGPGQGFKNPTTHRERPAGTDAQGRALKEVWVEGRPERSEVAGAGGSSVQGPEVHQASDQQPQGED